MPDLHDLLERRAAQLRPAPIPTAFDRTMRQAERRQRNRRLGAAVLALVMFAGAGTGLWIAFQPGAERHAPPAAEFPVPGPTSTIMLPSAPSGVTVASDGTVWATLPDALAKIDPATGQVAEEYGDIFSAKPGDLTGITLQQAGQFEIAWISDSGGFVWQVTIAVPPNAHILPPPPRPVDVGGPALGVAFGISSVWVTVAHEGPGELVRIDPKTDKITGRFTTGDGPGAVAVGEGGVWVQVTSGNARLQRFDPSTGELVGEQEGGGVVAATANEAWASGSDTVQRVMPGTAVTVPIISPEPSGGPPRPSPLPSAHVPGAGALTISGDQVWAVANPNPDRNGLLYEIDRRTGDIIGAPTPVGLTPTAVVVADGSVWVANYNDPSVTRAQLLCADAPCAGPLPTPTSPPRTTGPTPTTSSPPTSGSDPFLRTPPVPFLAGSMLFGEGVPLQKVFSTGEPYAGGLSPVATLADPNTLIYNSFAVEPGPGDIGTTSIRAEDLTNGRDRTLVNSAFSFAIRNDGAIAYFRYPTLDIHNGDVPAGSIEVAPSFDAASLDSTASTWSTQPANYVIIGWAGDTLLLVERVGAEDTPSDVLAIDGPGQVRVLAPSASVVAISPDGTRVLLSERPRPPERPLGMLAVVDPSDGHVLTAVAEPSLIDTASGHAVGLVEGMGEWTGDTVVAPDSSGTALLRVTDSSVAVIRNVVVDAFGPLAQPQFVDGDPDRIMGAGTRLGQRGGQFAWLLIDLSSGTADVRESIGWLSPVEPVRSLSRPGG